MNMGTRFMATREAPIHDKVKQAIVAGDERSTALILRSLRNTARVFGNSVARQAIAMEREGKGIDAIGPVVAGSRGRVVYETGELEHGIWSASTSMGLIGDIPSCKELVQRIVAEAEALIRGRLAGMAAA
jgi:nitronate monooxygenase